MKANYKIVANKQKMLEKEIENFEPTSTSLRAGPTRCQKTNEAKKATCTNVRTA